MSQSTKLAHRIVVLEQQIAMIKHRQQINEDKKHREISSGKWAAGDRQGQVALNTAAKMVYNKSFDQLDSSIRSVMVAAITAASMVETQWTTNWRGKITDHYTQFVCFKPEEVIEYLRDKYPEIITDSELNSAVTRTVIEWRKYYRNSDQ